VSVPPEASTQPPSMKFFMMPMSVAAMGLSSCSRGPCGAS
jgi:hypothetical protein